MGGVDDRETLIELAQIFARRLRLGVKPGAEPRPDRIEPVGDDASEVRLPRPQPFRHSADPPGKFRARLRERSEARLDRLLPFVGDFPLSLSRGASRQSAIKLRPQAPPAAIRPRRAPQSERLGRRHDDGDQAGGHLWLADALCVMAGLVLAIHAAASRQTRRSMGAAEW